MVACHGQLRGHDWAYAMLFVLCGTVHGTPSPFLEEVFRHLLAGSVDAEGEGVVPREEVLHVLRRLHQRCEGVLPLVRQSDHRREHPVCRKPRRAFSERRRPNAQVCKGSMRGKGHKSQKT